MLTTFQAKRMTKNSSSNAFFGSWLKYYFLFWFETDCRWTRASEMKEKRRQKNYFNFFYHLSFLFLVVHRMYTFLYILKRFWNPSKKRQHFEWKREKGKTERTIVKKNVWNIMNEEIIFSTICICSFSSAINVACIKTYDSKDKIMCWNYNRNAQSYLRYFTLTLIIWFKLQQICK